MVDGFSRVVAFFLIIVILNCVITITRVCPVNSRVPSINSFLLLFLFMTVSSFGSMYFIYCIKILNTYDDMKETNAFISDDSSRNHINFKNIYVIMIGCHEMRINYQCTDHLFKIVKMGRYL